MGIFSKDRDSNGNVGGWWVHSPSDSRWHLSGFSCGMWAAQEDAKKAVEVAKKHLGEPPSDLEYGWMKY